MLITNFIISFLFRFAFIYPLYSQNWKHILLDLHETTYNTSIISSAVSSSNLTLYICLMNSGIKILDLSFIDDPSQTLNEISSLNINASLMAYMETNQLWILDQTQNTIWLYFYDVSANEQLPKLINKTYFQLPSKRQMYADSWQFRKNNNTGNYYIYFLEKSKGIVILEVDLDYKLNFIVEYPIPDCKRFVFHPKLEGYLFYHTTQTLNLLNMTDFTNISSSDIDTTKGVGHQTYPPIFNQLQIAPDQNTLILFYCARFYGYTVFFNFDISNISNITYMYYNYDYFVDCDVARDEIFIIFPDINYALITDYLGITFLLLPNFEFHTRIKFWCSTLYVLSNGYFIGIDNNNGKIKSLQSVDIDVDEVPYSLVNVIDDQPGFWAWNHSHFIVPLTSNMLLVMFDGFPGLCDITDRVSPNCSDYLANNNEFASNSQPAYSYVDQNSPYFLIYTLFDNQSDGYIIITFNKNDFSQRGIVRNASTFNWICEKSVQITQINNIAYLIPFTFAGYSDLDKIQALNLDNTGELSLEPTNIFVGIVNNLAEITSCIINNDSYIFYTHAASPDLHISQMDPTNYTLFVNMSTLFIGIRVKDMKLSQNCNIIFLGGDSLIIIDITDKLNPFEINIIPLTNIKEIQVFKDRFLYVMTESSTLKIDVSNPYYPKFLMNHVFPFIYNAEVTPYSSAIIDDPDFAMIYHYRPFRNYYDNDDYDWRSPFSLSMEEQSPYYVRILNYPEIEIGIPVTLYYIVIATGFQFYRIEGAITSVKLAPDVNSIDESQMPSWIVFDFNRDQIHITADRSYLGRNITIVFVFSGSIETDYVTDNTNGNHSNYRLVEFQQTITFAQVQGSLKVNIDAYNHIFIQTPSPMPLIVILTFLDQNQSFNFIEDPFTGVFLTNSIKESKLTATGFLDPINSMLSLLRYRQNMNSYNNSFNFMISISDQLNVVYIDKYSISLLKSNQIPVLWKSIQQQLEEAILLNNTICKPTKNFEFSFLKNSYVDNDGDSISYSVHNLNSQNVILPMWLNFDENSLTLYGTPNLEDEGEYLFKIIIDDGHDSVESFINFTIFDYPPMLLMNLANKTCKIGENQSYYLPINTFVDYDGPLSLFYDYQIINPQCEKIDLSSFWLKFSKDDLFFYGIPYDRDMLICNFFQVYVIASDGLKIHNTSFFINVIQSLVNQNLKWPIQFNYTQPSTQINLNLSTNGSKLLILQVFEGNVQWKTQENFSKIQIYGTLLKVNDVLTDLRIRRDILLFNESVEIKALDEYGQNWEGVLKMKDLPSDNEKNTLNANLTQSTKLVVEIGSIYRHSFERNLFIIKDTNMTIKYFFSLQFEGKTTDIIQFSEDSFELYSSTTISESLYGTYQAVFSIEDEFLEVCELDFLIVVDYSLNDKIIRIVKYLASIIGPCISFLALVKYYNYIYNLFKKKSYQIQNKIITIKKPFKWKFPFIKEDYCKTVIIIKEFEKILKKENSDLFKEFLNQFEENANFPKKPLNSFHDFGTILENLKSYNKLSPEKKETIQCLVEGFLLKAIIKRKIPGFKKIFNILMSSTKRKLKLKKESDSQWYNFYFLENSSSKENSISSYLLKTGKYEICEENISINLDLLKKNLEEVLCRISSSKKFKAQTWKEKYFDFIIYALILCKRGIFYSRNPISLKIENNLEFIGLKFSSYRIGDSLFAHTYDLNHISCKLKLSKNIMKNDFFTFESKNVPNWMSIEQKRGILTIKGEAPVFEKNREYYFTIKDKWNLIMCSFGIIINDDENHQSLTFSKSKNKSLKVKVLKNLSYKNTEEVEFNTNKFETEIISPTEIMSPEQKNSVKIKNDREKNVNTFSEINENDQAPAGFLNIPTEINDNDEILKNKINFSTKK